MIFEIDVAGRRRVLTVEPLEPAGPAGGRFRVAVRTGETAHDPPTSRSAAPLLNGGADLQVGPVRDGGADLEVRDGGADLQVGPPVPDEILDLDVRPTDLGLSLIDRATGRVVDVAVTERGAGQWLLQFPAGSITAIVDGRLSGTRGGTAGTSGAQRVSAPMPGRVVRVLVQPGDEVTARQGLVVIEAMKMENELTAVRGGRVREVTVAPGAAVEAGRLLVVIE
jgi:biotin carboxyl carrier protein